MTVASLTSGLLARKGDARPSGPGAGAAMPARGGASSVRMAPLSAVRPELSASPVPAPEPAVPAVAGGPGHAGPRPRVSLRLDPARHRRLRLAAVHLETSLQQLLTEALDAHLERLGLDCACVRGAATDCGPRCRHPGARA